MQENVIKTLAATIKMFKPIESYMTHHKKVQDAFTILDERVEEAKTRHKDALSKAGALEARRLLGEIKEEEAQSLDNDLTNIRHEQDRLESARKALDGQMRVLFSQAESQSSNAGRALSDLIRVMEEELNGELEEASALVTSVINRLYALRVATGLPFHKQRIFDIEIPSIVGDKNYFTAPVRYHPRDGHILENRWKQDQEAVTLYEKLEYLGKTFAAVQRLEREAGYAKRRGEDADRVLAGDAA